ncbi:MAG: hypothetical protein M3Q36_02150 [bacterium]|nr:hypothetical protein [bacterium]
MTVTNHAIFGAILGAVFQPVIAVPLAFASHFLLDILPHFGLPRLADRKKSKFVRLFIVVLKLDTIGLIALFIILGVTKNFAMLAAAFAAFSPDIAWVYRYVITERWGRLEPGQPTRFNRFHKGIQRLESPQGILLEIPLAAVMVAILWRLT